MKWDADISENSAHMTDVIVVAPIRVIEMKPALFEKVFNVLEGPIVNTSWHFVLNGRITKRVNGIRRFDRFPAV